MAFKVGQKVKVKTGLDSERKYEGVWFPQEMKDKFEGKTVIISSAEFKDGKMIYHLTQGGWVWVDSFFEPAIITQDEAFQSLLDGHLSDAEYEELIKVIKNN